jgi:membrane fusion protein (multidrug efflux system)
MKTFLTILGLVAILATIGLIKFFQINTLIHAKAVIPPESVSTTQAKLETWQRVLTSVGSLSAVQGVTVAAELDGKVVEIDFEAGTRVKAGDILVRQDTSAE